MTPTEIMRCPAWVDALPQGVSVTRLEHASLQYCRRCDTPACWLVNADELGAPPDWPYSQRLCGRDECVPGPADLPPTPLPPAPLTLPPGTLPAPVVELERGPSTWRRVFEGVERRYQAGVQSLLDRPDSNLRVQAVVPRTGKGGGFVVVCRVGDNLRQVAAAGVPASAGRLAEAHLTFVLRRAASGSGRLLLDRPCRRDPDDGPPFPRPYGRLTVVGGERTADGAYVIGGGPVASRWWLVDADAERLIRDRVLPELAWSWLDRVRQAQAADEMPWVDPATAATAVAAEFTVPKVQLAGLTVTGAGVMELPWVDSSTLGAAWRPEPWALAEERDVYPS